MPGAPRSDAPRRPFRDNPRLILAGIVLLLVALAGTLALARGSLGLSPDFLTEFVLYALSAAGPPSGSAPASSWRATS